jgi:hypothetical protein
MLSCFTGRSVADPAFRLIRSVVQNGTITVDLALTGDLPKGAVPDLSVDGTIAVSDPSGSR